MPGTLVEALDNLYTTTWQNMKSQVADQIFDATPFYFWLKSKGKMKTVSGGRFITEPLQYAKNDNVTWIGRGGTVSLNDQEFLTVAYYEWRYLVASIVRFGVDDQKNRGKNQIINLMMAKLQNARDSLISELESRLFAGEGSSQNAMDGLLHLVQDDPTVASTVGGIDQSANSWWRNQSINMTGVSFASSGVENMRKMLNNTMNNLKMDAPDIIVCGQQPYEFYEDNLLSYYRITNNKLGDAGFQNQVFKGIPMVWSPSCGNRMYFLNTRFINLVYDPALFFDMTEWKAIPDQVNDRAAQIVSAMQLTVSRRRCQGVIYGIDTA